MSQVRVLYDGREVEPHEVDGRLERAILDAVVPDIEQALVATACPVHAERATVVIEGLDGDTLELKVVACCETLHGAVMEAIGGEKMGDDGAT